MHYGAIVGDWTHFDLILGLTADLLPVVSNPTATISPQSKIKELGKTPSKYNNNGHATGITAWTGHVASSANVEFWSKTPDYGICVQTRYARALDIDVPDAEVAQRIAVCWIEALALDLLCERPALRTRANSGKRLVMFALKGEYAKRRMTVDGGIVEFLATGQQFIAVGTHPSGARYEWDGGLPNDIIEVTAEAFERAWTTLTARFATGDVSVGRVGQQVVRAKNVTITDPLVPFLQTEGWTTSVESDGRVHIRCPFEDSHSGDPAEASTTATTYFPAGTGNFQQGHFSCLHAHCTGRTDGEYLDAMGYVASQFDVVDPAAADEAEDLLPSFSRNKAGAIEATLTEVVAALRSATAAGWRIAYDTFKDELMMASTKGRIETVKWRPMTDADYTRLRLRLESIGFKPVARELMRDAVVFIAAEIQIDSAQLWLSSLQWDGIPRVNKFLHTYFAAEKTDYAKAVSRYIWSAMAGRVLEPGCKADMMPILQGDQGIRKSSGIAAMAPSMDMFCELSFSEIHTDNIARKMRGMLVAEFAEMDGLHNRELEQTKKFTTRTHEQWVPKFKEFTTTFPRRLVFIGSTNEMELLNDPSGNRRWLPIKVHDVDVPAIVRDREQLWAEGAQMFMQDGIQFHIAEKLAVEEHAAFVVHDLWESSIASWLELQLTDITRGGKQSYMLDEIILGSLGMPPRDVRRVDQMRCTRILKQMGWHHVRRYRFGVQHWAWEPKNNSLCDLL